MNFNEVNLIVGKLLGLLLGMELDVGIEEKLSEIGCIDVGSLVGRTDGW